MLKMDISSFVFLYIAASLVFLFVLWIFFEKSNALPKFIRPEADVWECAICAHTYVDSTHQGISCCPQCKSYNKKSAEERLL